MRARLVTTAVAGLVALAGVVGCTSGPTTTPPASTTNQPSTSATPKSEIANPLDLTKLAANICNGLTDVQVEPYSGTPRKKNPEQTSNGPVCAILAQTNSGPALGVGVVNIAAPTEDLLYATTSNYPWRQKINPIAGYPSVDASEGSDSQSGDCTTDVAVNATQGLHIQFTASVTSDPNYTKPCTVSETLMAELIQNIKSGST